jgi:predicted nucleic acid-binding protein
VILRFTAGLQRGPLLPETPQNQSISRPVLANHALTDVFLTFAEEPRLFLPRWSEEILEETRRAHEKLSWPVDLIDYFQQQVRGHFPEALVTNYKRYIDLCENDPKDRHVLACAIAGQAEIIVTFNLSDFPAEALNESCDTNPMATNSDLAKLGQEIKNGRGV